MDLAIYLMALYWGWVVCGSFFILLTQTIGIVLVYNEVLIQLSEEFDVPISILTWMGSLPLCVSFLLIPLGAYLNFKIGTRKTTMIGVLTTTIFLALTPIMRSFALLFIVYGVCLGISRALIFHPPFFLLAQYFPYEHPRHVFATGINYTAFPLATLLFNPIAVSLVDLVGWRITYSILAASMFVIGVSTAMTFRAVRDDEGKAKLDTPVSKKEEYEEITPSNIVIAKKTKYIMCTIWIIASILKGIGFITPFVTLVKMMVVRDVSQSQASIVMVVLGSSEFLSRLVTSVVGDYFKGKIIFLYSLFALGLSIVTGLGSMASQFTHFIIYGAFLGILEGPIIAALYSSSSEVLLGQDVTLIYQLCMTGIGFGGIIGPTVTGAIFDVTGSFRVAFYFNSAIYFTAALLYGLVFLLTKSQPECVFPRDPESASEEKVKETSDKFRDEDINVNQEIHEMSSTYSDRDHLLENK